MSTEAQYFSSPVSDALLELRSEGHSVDSLVHLQQLLRTSEVITKWIGLLAIPWESPDSLSDVERRVLQRALESGSFGAWQQVCQVLGRGAGQEDLRADAPRVDFRVAAAGWSKQVLAPIASDSLPDDTHVIKLRNQFQHGWGSPKVEDSVLRELLRRIEELVAGFPLLTERIVVETRSQADEMEGGTTSRVAQVRTAESDVSLFPLALLWSENNGSANHSLIVFSRYGAQRKSTADYFYTHRFGVKQIGAGPGQRAVVERLGALLPRQDRRHPLIDLEAEFLAGRDDVLAEALRAVAEAGPGSVLMLEAEPGAGKSALMARLSRELAELSADHRDRAVYGTYFSNSMFFERSRQQRTDPRLVLSEISELIGPDDRDGTLDELVDLIVSRCEERQRREQTTLLLVDGLDEIARLIRTEGRRGPEAEFLTALRRIAGAGATVVASRRSGTGEPLLTGAKEQLLLVEPLRRLTFEESVKVLDERLGDLAINHEPETLAEVARRSEGLPLFLEMAAKDLRHNDWTTAQPHILDSLQEYFDALRANADAATGVSDDILALLAYAGSPVPVDAMEQAVRDDATAGVKDARGLTERALDILAPLLTEDPEGGYRLFHASVGDYLRTPTTTPRESLADRADRWIESLHRWVHDESVSAVCRDFALLHGGRLLLERRERKDSVKDRGSDGSLPALIEWVTDEKLAEMQYDSVPAAAIQGLGTIQRILETASEQLALKDTTRLALLRTRRQALVADAVDPLRILRASLADGIVPNIEELLEVVPSEQRGLMHLALLIEVAIKRRRGLDVDPSIFAHTPRVSARWQPNEVVLRLALARVAPEFGISELTDGDLDEEIDLFAELTRNRPDVLETVLAKDDVALAVAVLSRMRPSASNERRLLAERILVDEDRARAYDSVPLPRTLVLRAVAGDDAAEKDVRTILLTGTDRTALVGSCLRFGLTAPLEAALKDSTARAPLRRAISKRRGDLKHWRMLRNQQPSRNICLAIEHEVLGPRTERSTGKSRSRRISPDELRLLGFAARAARDPKLLARIVNEFGTRGARGFSNSKWDKPYYARAWLDLGLAGHEGADPHLLELALVRLSELADSLPYPRNKREILEKRASLLAQVRRTDEALMEYRRAMELALDSRLDNEVARFSSGVLSHVGTSDLSLLPDVTTMLLRSRRESTVAYERARLYLEAAQERSGHDIVGITPARIRSKLLDREKLRLDADARVLRRGTTKDLGHVLSQGTYNVLFDFRLARIAGSFSLDELYAVIDALAPRGEEQRSALSTLRAMDNSDAARHLGDLYRKGNGKGEWEGHANAAPWLARGLPHLLWESDVDSMNDTCPLDIVYRYGHFDRNGLWYVPALVRPPDWASPEDFVAVLLLGAMATLEAVLPAVPVALLAASLSHGPGAAQAGRALNELKFEDIGAGQVRMHLFDRVTLGFAVPVRDAESVLAVARGLKTPWDRTESRLVDTMHAICHPNEGGGRSDSISEDFGTCESEDLVRLEVIAAALRDPLRFAREAFRVLEPSPACDVVGGILASIAGLLPPERRHIDDVLDFITEQEKALDPEDVAVIRLAKLYYSRGSDRFLPTAREATSALRQAGTAAVRLASGDEDLLRHLAPLCSSRAEHAYALVEETVIHEPRAAHDLAVEFARNVAPDGGTFGRR